MNRQKTAKGRGIEWTDFTWNPVGGCLHSCRWTMPDGTEAICYAEAVAEKVARPAYPEGFAHHYWHPQRLEEPLLEKTPSMIFMDSMSDLMGHWVADEEIEQVLNTCRLAHWHKFQLLTKNAPRLKKFKFPPNVWVGVSAPPTYFMGKKLHDFQQERMVRTQLDVLAEVYTTHFTEHRTRLITWMSIEPLSFDIAPILADYPLDWMVIGAASNGNKTYQPEPLWVENLLAYSEVHKVPTFYKGNLNWEPRLEEFPI